jgi:hypothetical protein
MAGHDQDWSLVLDFDEDHAIAVSDIRWICDVSSLDGDDDPLGLLAEFLRRSLGTTGPSGL